MSHKNRMRDYCPNTNPIVARSAGYGQVDLPGAADRARRTKASPILRELLSYFEEVAKVEARPDAANAFAHSADMVRAYLEDL